LGISIGNLVGTQWEHKNPKPKIRDFFQSLKGSHTDPIAIRNIAISEM
jgi:hypothetical protein